MFKHIKNNKGFTLIELMIVIAIIGILTAIAVPSFNTYRDKAKESGADSVLASVYTEVKILEAEGDIFAKSTASDPVTASGGSTLVNFKNDSGGSDAATMPAGYSKVGFDTAIGGTNTCDYAGNTSWKVGALGVTGASNKNRSVSQDKVFASSGSQSDSTADVDPCD